MRKPTIEIKGYGKAALIKITDRNGIRKTVENNKTVWRFAVRPYRYTYEIRTVDEPTEELYADSFCRIEANKWFGIYVAKDGDYKLMSVPVAKFIASRMYRNQEKAFMLLDAIA